MKNSSETNYSVTITSVSKQLTAKEKIMLKDMTNAVKLDNATKTEGNIDVQVDYYATLNVHNEKSDDKDYVTYVVVDTNGTKYTTGSQSFWSAFNNIITEVNDAGLKSDEWLLRIFRLPSRTREGKDFITCSMV